MQENAAAEAKAKLEDAKSQTDIKLENAKAQTERKLELVREENEARKNAAREKLLAAQQHRKEAREELRKAEPESFLDSGKKRKTIKRNRTVEGEHQLRCSP